MAQFAFTGPGILTLQNDSGSVPIYKIVAGKNIFWKYIGWKKESLSIPISGDFYAEWPDSWGSVHCDCPVAPIFQFDPFEVVTPPVATPPAAKTISRKLDSAGTYTRADMGLPADAVLACVSAMVEMVGDATNPPAYASGGGDPLSLDRLGEQKSFGQIQFHEPSNSFIDMGDFTLTLGAGDCVEILLTIIEI